MMVPVECLSVFLTLLAFSPEVPVNCYTRPDSASSQAGTITPGETVEIQVLTDSGWLGFDPGTAQAGNTGSFRYRWISPESAGLQLVWAPSAGILYAMTGGPVNVFSEPDSLSPLLGSLPEQSAAAVDSTAGEWLRIEYGDETGWIRSANVSLNFPGED